MSTLSREQVLKVKQECQESCFGGWVTIPSDDFYALIDTDEALRDQVARLTAERDELFDNLARCKGNELAAELAAMTAERDAFIQGGVTEELLRKHDGYIKVDKGLCVVVEAEFDALRKAAQP